MTRLNTLPASTKPTNASPFQYGARSFDIEYDQAVAALREPLRVQRLHVPSRSSAKPRTVVSPPAKKRSLAGSSRITVGNDSADRRPACVEAEPGHEPWRRWAISNTGGTSREAHGHAEAGAGSDDHTAAGQAAIDEALHERLHEPHFGTEQRAATEVSTPTTAPRCGSSTSSRESRSDRAEERRQPHLREQPVDQQLIFGRDLLVERASCSRRYSGR